MKSSFASVETKSPAIHVLLFTFHYSLVLPSFLSFSHMPSYWSPLAEVTNKSKTTWVAPRGIIVNNDSSLLTCQLPMTLACNDGIPDAYEKYFDHNYCDAT